MAKKENMIFFFRVGLLASLLPVVFSSVAPTCLASKEVRPQVYAGQFYPEKPAQLKAAIAELWQNALESGVRIPGDMELKALIMPHAGMVYSGMTAAHVLPLLNPGDFKKVILICPDHRSGFKGCGITGYNGFKTPLGVIDIHKDTAILSDQSEYFGHFPDSDLNEHGIEVALPFLQTGLETFDLLPVVAGACDIHQTARAVMKLLDRQTLLVVSSDLSHYLPYEKAVQSDRQTIEWILNFNDKSLGSAWNAACGRVPLLILITVARELGWKPFLLHYSNSGDTAGSKQQVVGYCAMAFFSSLNHRTLEENTVTKEVSPKQGKALLVLARHSIAQKLGIKDDALYNSDLEKFLENEVFNQKRGTFVTLHINDHLRGCIGSLEPVETLKEGVARNAVNAAFKDPRFSQLSEDEFDNIEIEVSILSKPEKLVYTDADDLVKKLRPGIDGVIIKKGWSKATFLPQVWDQLPDAENFLSQLCNKAGMSKHEWKNGKLEVMTYQVQYFEESR